MANASLAGDLVSDDTGFRMTLGDDLVRDTPKPHIRAWIKLFGAHLFMGPFCRVIIEDGNTLRGSLLTALSAPPAAWKILLRVMAVWRTASARLVFR